MNVFLGIGLPWSIAAIYWTAASSAVTSLIVLLRTATVAVTPVTAAVLPAFTLISNGCIASANGSSRRCNREGSREE